MMALGIFMAVALVEAAVVLLLVLSDDRGQTRVPIVPSLLMVAVLALMEAVRP